MRRGALYSVLYTSYVDEPVGDYQAYCALVTANVPMQIHGGYLVLCAYSSTSLCSVTAGGRVSGDGHDIWAVLWVKWKCGQHRLTDVIEHHSLLVLSNATQVVMPSGFQVGLMSSSMEYTEQNRPSTSYPVGLDFI